MNNQRIKLRWIIPVMLAVSSCKLPSVVETPANPGLPSNYTIPGDTNSSAEVKWRTFFNDPVLVQLIDTAINNNPEALIALQEIEIARSHIRAQKGKLFPSISAGIGAGFDKSARYTAEGAGNASTDITPGVEVPEPIGDYYGGFQAGWEADVWGKLRNYSKAAYAKYLGSVEGRNFVMTNLVAEVADTYYELLALDQQLEIVQKNIKLSEDELEIVRVQKEASKVTELAVKQFEAQVYNSKSKATEIKQEIQETENRLNYLLGKYTTTIPRNAEVFSNGVPQQVTAGLPSQLLNNRPDIRQAEMEMAAAKCEVKAAKAEFLPSFEIRAGIGYRAFKTSYLFDTPESVIYNLAGDLVAPLINRSAIKAEFNAAKAAQLQAMYEYQKAVLNAYAEVATEMNRMQNLQTVYDMKSQEVSTRMKAVDISRDLFNAARADYLEVLIAQQEALESQLEQVETKKMQFITSVHLYKALGGGWK